MKVSSTVSAGAELRSGTSVGRGGRQLLRKLSRRRYSTVSAVPDDAGAGRFRRSGEERAVLAGNAELLDEYQIRIPEEMRKQAEQYLKKGARSLTSSR